MDFRFIVCGGKYSTIRLKRNGPYFLSVSTNLIHFIPIFCTDNPDYLIISCSCQPLTIRTKFNVYNITGTGGDLFYIFCCLYIQYPDRPIRIAYIFLSNCQYFPIRAKGHSMNLITALFTYLSDIARFHIHDRDRAMLCSGCHRLTVRAIRKGSTALIWRTNGCNQFPGHCVPEPYYSVITDGCQHTAIRLKGQICYIVRLLWKTTNVLTCLGIPELYTIIVICTDANY